MKAVVLIFAAIVMIGFLPLTIESINDFRSRDYTAPYIITTTASSEADIILSQPLFSGATANVVLASNITADAPIPITYVSATKTLTITGLALNSVRNLSVVYKIDALTDYFGAGVVARIWPAVIILGIISLIASAVYVGTRRGE